MLKNSSTSLLKALEDLSLKNLVIPKSIWRKLVGAGSDAIHNLSQAAGMTIRDQDGALLGVVMEGKLASCEFPKEEKSGPGEPVCGRCGYSCERCESLSSFAI